MVAHSHNPRVWGAEVGELNKVQGCLVYKASSRPDRVTQGDLLSKQAHVVGFIPDPSRLKYQIPARKKEYAVTKAHHPQLAFLYNSL